MIIYREIQKEFERLLPYFRVFVVTGPRQSGKTTLCKHYFSEYAYFNMEVDILQEFGNQYHAYEVKSAKAFHTDFLNNLKYLKTVMGNESLIKTHVIYDGDIDVNAPENGMMNIRNIF